MWQFKILWGNRNRLSLVVAHKQPAPNCHFLSCGGETNMTCDGNRPIPPFVFPTPVVAKDLAVSDPLPAV
eukprot:scaffold165616_cov58-Attheya_sp.AAC.2